MTERHTARLLMSEFVTHDVERFVVSRPSRFGFEPSEGKEALDELGADPQSVAFEQRAKLQCVRTARGANGAEIGYASAPSLPRSKLAGSHTRRLRRRRYAG
jgi:hypothetical protein